MGTQELVLTRLALPAVLQHDLDLRRRGGQPRGELEGRSGLVAHRRPATGTDGLAVPEARGELAQLDLVPGL
jgi:hypothetical protein